MKKLLALLLVCMMIFALAACGNNETPSGSEGDNPGTSQTDDGLLNREEDKGELWDVADSDITILNEGHDVAIVPAGLKKGIGTQSKARNKLRDPGSSFEGIYKSLYEASYEEVVQADVDALVDHIEQDLGLDANKGEHSSYTEYMISTDTMHISVLYYPNENCVKVSAYLNGEENNGGENNKVGVEWPDNEYTRLVPELPASILAICTETYVVDSLSQCGFSYYDEDPSLEDLQGYMQALKDAGFTEKINDEFTTDASGFNFGASNSEGYRVKLTHDYFIITKEQ